jgi:hypothetical protein
VQRWPGVTLVEKRSREALQRIGDTRPIANLRVNLQRRAESGQGASRIVLLEGDLRQAPERVRLPPPVAHLAADRQALHVVRAGLRQVAKVQCQLPQVLQDLGDALAVAEKATEHQRLLVERARGGVVPAGLRGLSQAGQCDGRAKPISNLLMNLQRRLAVVCGVAKVAPTERKPAQDDVRPGAAGPIAQLPP